MTGRNEQGAGGPAHPVGWGVHGLTVRYRDEPVLHDVDLQVAPGEVVAVVGGDGDGKTTLLRTLVGAIRPAAGSVHAPARERIGFMPTTAGVWAELSVDENIDFVAAVQGLRGPDLAARRDRLLAGTGLAGARDRLGAQLSGGMRQKLAFALATLHAPDLLVLDEPTTGVDPVSRVDLWRLVSQAAAGGAAVVLATTYLDEAQRAARVLLLAGGRVLLAGPPAQVVREVAGAVVRLADAGPAPVAAGAPGGAGTAGTGTAGTGTAGTGAWGTGWRRGHERHAWLAPGEPVPPGATVLLPDLEDAAIAATLATELATERSREAARA